MAELSRETQGLIERTLAEVPLLARLSDRQRSRLARRATTRSYGEGSVIVRQGDTSMALYVVLSGAVRIQHEGEGRTPLVVSEAGEDRSFGEMGLIDDEPRSATVIAVEPTVCALLAKWDFQNELRDDPDIAIALLPVLSDRIRQLHARLSRIQGDGVSGG